MKVEVLAGEFSVCKVGDYGGVDLGAEFTFTGSTDGERSLVCPAGAVPEGTLAREDGWRGMRVEGTLDFGLVGVLAGLSAALAGAGVGIFAVSTYDTDYLFVKGADLGRAVETLRAAGYGVEGAA